MSVLGAANSGTGTISCRRYTVNCVRGVASKQHDTIKTSVQISVDNRENHDL